MAQKEQVDVYTIPPNFAIEGTILSGRVEARNAVEAVILVLVLLWLLMKMNLGVKGKIYVGIIVILPVAIFSVIGVQGESLTSFVFQLFTYLTKRRILTMPSSQYRLKRNRKLKKQQQKQVRRAQKGGKGHGKRSKRIEAAAERSKEKRKAGEKESEKTEKGGI